MENLIVWIAVLVLGVILFLLFALLAKKQEYARMLKEKEEMESFFTLNLDLLCIANANGEFLKTNQAWSEILGYDAQQLAGTPFLDYVHPDDIEATLTAMSRLSEGVDVKGFTNRYRSKDGSYRYLEWRSHPKGDLIYATARDITEKQEVEEFLQASQIELQRSTRLLHDAESLAKIGGWEYEVETQKMYWTEGLFELHEFEESEEFDHITESIQCYKPEDRKKIVEAFKECITEAKPYDMVFPFFTHSGKERWIRTKTAPMLEESKVVRIIGIVMDITEQKEYEDIIKKEQKRAEDASRAKSEFLANVSHEIRTPMNAVIGLGSILEDMELGEREHMMVKKINSSSKMLLSILNDILDYSKIEANMLILESKAFRLTEIAEQIDIMYSDLAKEKGVAFAIKIDENLPYSVIGDLLRLEQVMSNLCSNAIKFTKEGSIDIALELLKKESSQAFVKFSVRDSGIGMSKEQVSKLFESFTQADSSITREYGGTGLGLAISKKIIEAMGSTIVVESQKGIGSHFYFTIAFKIDQFEDDGLAERIEYLKERLRESEPIGADERERLYDALEGRVDASSLQKFKEALDNYDFDRALVEAQRWLIY